MKSSQVLLQIFPFLLIGYLACLVGASIWPIPGSFDALFTRGFILILAFLGLIGLKNSPNWNVVFLLFFAFVLGSFSTLDHRMENIGSWATPLFLAIAVVVGCFFMGQRIRHGVGEFSQGIWLLSWVYILGWVGIDLLDLELLLQAVWAGFGLALFGGLITFWFAQLRSNKVGLRGSALGIDLFLLSVNVVVAIRILLLSLGFY